MSDDQIKELKKENVKCKIRFWIFLIILIAGSIMSKLTTDKYIKDREILVGKCKELMKENGEQFRFIAEIVELGNVKVAITQERAVMLAKVFLKKQGIFDDVIFKRVIGSQKGWEVWFRLKKATGIPADRVVFVDKQDGKCEFRKLK